ncbi:glycerol-3-phosphate cytidylyltransferase [Candidatus Parcubacteria bacterium]|nr:glycerol-3-phosphate cytidylyltransferase [Candidatus Parcubacteria bacterium]
MPDLLGEKRNTKRCLRELLELAKGRKVGVTASSFDLLHAGHSLMLKESWDHLVERCAKGEEPFLLVLLQSDPTLDRKDKNRPVQSLEERFIQISANRHVSYVMLYDTEADLFAILQALEGIVEVRFIGDDWKDKAYTGKGLSFEIFWNNRSHGYSTTALRERVWRAEEEKRRPPYVPERRRHLQPVAKAA